MIKATSPAAKISPMITEAIRARDTNTSALMSKRVTRPSMASLMIGIPQRRMAIQAVLKRIPSGSRKLISRERPEITRNKMLLFVSLRNKSFIDEIIALLLS